MKWKKPSVVISKQTWRMIISLTVIISLISMIVIILLVPRKNVRSSSVSEQGYIFEQRTLSNKANFGMEDFYRDARNPDIGETYAIRQRKKIWEKEDIDPYWINPSEAGIETLTQDNDAIIYDALGIKTE